MSCCGKTIRKVIAGQTIVTGNLFHLVGKKCPETDTRIRICRKCEYSTWMKKSEYAKWLFDNGVEVLKNIDQLEKLPMLPKYELDKSRRNIFCRLCKCFIPAKARLKDQKCILNKW